MAGWTRADDGREIHSTLGTATVNAICNLTILLDHLLHVAEELGILEEVRAALAAYTAVASVGPIMTASLEAAGLSADIILFIRKWQGW